MLDNDSGDGTAEMVGAEFPDVRLLALDENLGFAAGVNRAAEEARGEFLLLLNPDTVVHEGALDRLVRFRARATASTASTAAGRSTPTAPSTRARAGAQPSLWSLVCFATMLSTRVQGLARSSTRSRSAAGSATRSARWASSPAACSSLPRALWQRARRLRHALLHVRRGRRPRAARRGRTASGRRSRPTAVITHEIGVSSSSRPDKIVLLFRGKATLLRKHWSPGAQPRRDRAARLRRRRARAARRARAPGRPSGPRARSWVKGYGPAVRQARTSAPNPGRWAGEPAARAGVRRKADRLMPLAVASATHSSGRW